MIPAHAQQTLDDIAVIRQRLDDAEAAIRAVYVGQPDAVLPHVATGPVSTPPPNVVLPQPRAERPVLAVVDERPVKAAPPAPAKAPTDAGSKYDEPILRALKSETGAYGMPLSDVTRAIVGPGKPADVKRLIGTIYSALQSLLKRGQVRKDGRMWHVVRTGARTEVA